jgi:hypothetical protein
MRKFKVYLPPDVRGRRETYYSTCETLEEAVEDQRKGILERGTNAHYLLAHMKLPDLEAC